MMNDPRSAPSSRAAIRALLRKIARRWPLVVVPVVVVAVAAGFAEHGRSSSATASIALRDDVRLALLTLPGYHLYEAPGTCPAIAERAETQYATVAARRLGLSPSKVRAHTTASVVPTQVVVLSVSGLVHPRRIVDQLIATVRSERRKALAAALTRALRRGDAPRRQVLLALRRQLPVDVYVIARSSREPDVAGGAAAGAGAGLVVGLLLAGLLSVLDPRVRTTEELERVLGRPLIGTARLRDDTPEAPDAALRETATRLWLILEGAGARTVLIGGADPDSDSVRGARALAGTFAAAGLRVALFEIDGPEQPSPSLASALRNGGRFEEVAVETAEGTAPGATVLLVAVGANAPGAPPLLTRHRHELVHQAVDQTDVVVISCASLASVDALPYHSDADASVLVVDAATVTTRGLDRTIRELRATQVPCVGFIAFRS